jgi:hypothetical protein
MSGYAWLEEDISVISLENRIEFINKWIQAYQSISLYDTLHSVYPTPLSALQTFPLLYRKSYSYRLIASLHVNFSTLRFKQK